MISLAFFHSQTVLPRMALAGTEAATCDPPLDVYVTPDAVVVQVELPGTAASAVRITVEPGILVIEGVRGGMPAHEGRERVERVLYVERPAGEFCRRLRLPHPVDPAGGQARLERGVLTVRLPRRDPED